MKLGLLIALVVLLAAPAAAADLQVLWDQSDRDPAGGTVLDDASRGCVPGATTVHLASDIRLEAPVSIARITTYYAAAAPETFAATAEAWLWIAPKDGPLPPAAADPRRSGRLVTVRTRRVGGHIALVAGDLAIPLRAGDYWVSLTPVVAADFPGAGSHLCTLGPWGDASASFAPCGARQWLPAGPDTDATLRIEGSVEAAAEAAAGGPWPWRELR